ncbi:MAG: AIPR family protein, partial [Methylovulum sp.]|nr:AIPR family protein [Methylovulum sp.]
GFYPLEVLNPVIVNGLQTTHVLYEIYQQDKARLNGVFVVVRLYETTDNELIEKITNATNTQSPINFRDKISTRSFNDYTQDVFANAGIGYLCKRGETFDNRLSMALKKSVHSETVLKFWYATFYEQPERAKSTKSKVLEELFDATTNKNNKLYPLFKGNKDSPIYQQLLETFWIYDFVVTQRQTQAHTSDFVLFTDELLAYGVYKLLKKSGGFAQEQLAGAYQTIYEAIPACIGREQQLKAKNQSTYSHNDYFKSVKSRFHLNDILELSEDTLY